MRLEADDMKQSIFINLPVRDLDASKAFFASLGYTLNPQFTNELAACIVISEEIYVMLLTHDFFKTFTPYAICDTSKYTQVLNALNCENRQAVDDIVSKAISAGGKIYKEPQDHGFMYGHGFQDLDGHIWEYFYMDPNHVHKNT
jgi:uncharacterized protein